MSIRELLNQFEIEGAFIIKAYNEKTEEDIILDEGEQFEYQIWNDENGVLDRKITYMYADKGVLNIEVEYKD